MKIKIIAVGKLKEKYWTMAIQEYVKRISRYAKIEIVEVAEGKSLQDEGQTILKNASGFVIVTDIKGKLVTSEEFAKIFSAQMINGISEFSIIIGSSHGLHASVKSIATLSVSFGRITYPHQLMRVILSEQIYRAIAINNNLTYHK
ncbi:MAG: 23S rRNA (pseudouridine(1915)-N(3))-methyltransferase RlmH [Clostridiales bacterium]|nr:23S rRNA (pseudouridine(1915)-N(3))-methyltransferase RlmH [Clostridiales bacterium]